MKKNFCDRCGEEITLDGFIDGKTRRSAHGLLKDKGKDKLVEVTFSLQQITDTKTKNLDLCYNCSSDIFIFAHLRDGKSEEERRNDVK
jgi:hypothetical protein